MTKQEVINKVKQIIENNLFNNHNTVILNNLEYQVDNYINTPFLESHFHPNTLLFTLSRKVGNDFNVIKIRVRNIELINKLYESNKPLTH